MRFLLVELDPIVSSSWRSASFRSDKFDHHLKFIVLFINCNLFEIAYPLNLDY